MSATQKLDISSLVNPDKIAAILAKKKVGKAKAKLIVAPVAKAINARTELKAKLTKLNEADKPVNVSYYTEKTNHTRVAYTSLSDAYVWFNTRLFNAKLPHCLITLQRKKSALGYFSRDRFECNNVKTDEIALNPATFNERTPQQILSTLVHEMCHLQQFHFGEPSRAGYHNSQWAKMMKDVGLHPSHNGEVGGKEVGQKMTHYIVKDGAFELACAAFMLEYELALYADRAIDDKAAGKTKPNSKTKYCCSNCGCNAWAKPATNLVCGDCETTMECEGE